MDAECNHDRVVRLVVPGTCGPMNHWICTSCNTEFVLKSAVSWKIAHLVGELGRRMVDEQGQGVWAEEGLPL